MKQVDDYKGEIKGKRSIPLAVTMVLLVISIMLIVVYASKNIALSQAASITKGEAVVQNLAKLKQFEEQLMQNIDDIQQYAKEKPELARLTSAHSMPIIIAMTEELNELIEHASDFEKSVFNTSIPSSITHYEQALQQLQLIATTEGELSQAEYDELQALLDASEQRYTLISTFNFNVVESKNALIRIGNGFDWIELVEALEQQLNVEVK